MRRAGKMVGVAIVAAALMAASSSVSARPMAVSIYPNLDQARGSGFHLLAGHAPFTVDFRAEVEGGSGGLTYAWDFDGDRVYDSRVRDPAPFTYTEPGPHTALVRVSDVLQGKQVTAEQRVVAIGDSKWPGWRFGVSENLAPNAGEYASDTESEKSARMISEAGIQAVRFDLTWAAIQPKSSNEYRWEDYDYLVGLSRRHGFDLLPIIAYSSRWASTATNASNPEDLYFAPPTPSKYAWFAYKAAERYKDYVRCWEVWNEPNTSGAWRPQPDAARYAKLLKHAYLAIKYADPNAVVVSGGLAYGEAAQISPETFLQTLYKEGAGPYFDAVGSHPYTHPSEGTEGLLRRLTPLRSVMGAHGDQKKPIWLTEYGYYATPASGVTDRRQGAWLDQSFHALSSREYVGAIVWYNFRELGTDPNRPLYNFGLVEKDWTAKPAYTAYKNYIHDSS